jgi:hypothetical protein
MATGFMKATLACPVCGAGRVLKWFNIDKEGNYVGPEIRYDINYKVSYGQGKGKIFWETLSPSTALLQNLRMQIACVLDDIDALIAERLS